MVSHPELSLNMSIGSDRESGVTSRVRSALTISEGDRLKAESELGSIQQALVAAKEAC